LAYNSSTDYGKKLSTKQIQSVMRQLLSAIAHLHSLLICHKDIKPENVLVRERSADDVEIRLIDFNISQKAQDSSFNMISKTGTELFMAPEMISKGNFNEKIDVWGAGCILCYMLIGKLPMNGSKKQMGDD